MAKPCKETDQSHFVLVWNGGSITHACLRVHSHAQTRNYIYFSEWAVLEDCCNVKGCSFGSSQPQIKCVSIVLVHIIV